MSESARSAESATSGIDITELDATVRPQDDLYRHVNGKWENRTPIPADKARYGSFHILAEHAEEAVRDIIIEGQNAEPGSEERTVGDLYASFMDTELIEALGVAPIESQLAFAGNVSTVSGLLDAIGRLERHGVGGFLGLFVDNDPGNPERYLVFAEQGGLGLPDESYYRDEKFASARDSYVNHIQRMFELTEAELPSTAGLDDAAARAVRVFELETALAGLHWDNVRTRDSVATYNPLAWAAVHELVAEGARKVLENDVAAGVTGSEHAAAHAVDLDIWLTAIGAPAGALETVVVREPSFVEGLGSLLIPQHLEAWKDWLAWNIIHSAAPFLPADFVAENFDFYGRTLTGTPEQRARWKRGVSLVEGAMGESVGKIYVSRHFPEAAKADMDVLVDNLIEAYRESITALEWMSEETRGRALEKLDKFTPKVGYPVKWRDYSALVISATDLMGNVRRIAEFESAREFGKIGKPIDRDEWFMTPQTVNAYYNPGFNEIVFPAAILQPPFFDPAWDDAANYGSIGAVIGHEIGHGFDDQGSRFDGDGKLTDWWTEDDREAFEKRTASLIEQFNALAPKQVPGHFVNGELTIGENIGDLGGLAIAWKAYLISLKGAEPPVIDGLTGAQRFFLSWAQSWQQKGRDEEVIRLLAIDPHSPNEFRCNQIVRNIDAFYDAFAVTEQDAAWLEPAKRVTIW
jgi:putative endopeptidase